MSLLEVLMLGLKIAVTVESSPGPRGVNAKFDCTKVGCGLYDCMLVVPATP
jgi:hypothetical protein